MSVEIGLGRYRLASLLAISSLLIILVISWSEFDFFSAGMLVSNNRPVWLLGSYFLAALSYFLIYWAPIKISRRHFAWVIVLYLLAWLAWPMHSLDISSYLIGAKNMAVYGVNQMREPYLAVSINPWLHYLNDIYWRALPSPYGPFFWLIVWPLGLIKSVAVATYAYKTLIFVIGWWLVKMWLAEAGDLFDKDERSYRLLLLLLNPIVWLYGFAEAHNEMIWIALSLWGVRRLRRGAVGSAAISFVSVSLIKISSLLVWPIYYRALALNRKRAFLWLCVAVIGGLAIFLEVGHTKTTLLSSYSNMDGSCLSFCSPFVLTLSYLHISRVLVSAALLLCTVIVYLVRNNWPYDYLFWSYAIFFLMATTWLAPWYMLAPLIFGLLSKQRNMRLFSLLLCLMAIWLQAAVIIDEVVLRML